MTKIKVTDGTEQFRPFVYVIANKGLHMSGGKLAAQVAHAVMMAAADQSKELFKQWTNSMHRTIIVLEADDEAHMRNIHSYLSERGFRMSLIIDEGVNEITPYTVTAMASEVLDRNDPNVAAAFGSFKLYSDPIKVTLEIPR